VRAGEPATEGGEVTLSLKGRAFPQGGIRAHRDYAEGRITNFPVTQATPPVRSPCCHLFCDVKTAKIIEIFTSLD